MIDRGVGRCLIFPISELKEKFCDELDKILGGLVTFEVELYPEEEDCSLMANVTIINRRYGLSKFGLSEGDNSALADDLLQRVLRIDDPMAYAYVSGENVVVFVPEHYATTMSIPGGFLSS